MSFYVRETFIRWLCTKIPSKRKEDVNEFDKKRNSNNNNKNNNCSPFNRDKIAMSLQKHTHTKCERSGKKREHDSIRSITHLQNVQIKCLLVYTMNARKQTIHLMAS